MPTGYTADVQNGKITEFKDFAMQCARAFGALIMMRDEPSNAPIPERFEPRTKYYDEQIAGAEARIAGLKAMSPEEALKASLDAHAASMAEWLGRKRERQAARERYEAMLAHARVWVPPTADHEGMKSFMIQQLEESIRFDTSHEYDDEPVTPSGAQWLVSEIRNAERDLNYATEQRAEEIARTAKRNEWLAELRASLESASG